MIACTNSDGKFYITWTRDSDNPYCVGAGTNVYFSYNNINTGTVTVDLEDIAESEDVKEYVVSITTDYAGTYEIHFGAQFYFDGEEMYDYEEILTVEVTSLPGDNLRVVITNVTETSFTYSLLGLSEAQSTGTLFVDVYEEHINRMAASVGFDFNNASETKNILIPDLDEGITYYIKTELSWRQSGTLHTWTDETIVTTKGGEFRIPKCEFVSIERTSTDLNVTVKNTGEKTFSFHAYYTDEISVGTSIGTYDIPAGETHVFEKSLSSVQAYSPLFVYIQVDYALDSEDSHFVEAYFPKKTSYLTTTDGKTHKVLSTSKADPPYVIKVDITQEFPWDNTYGSYTVSPDIVSHYCFAPYTGSLHNASQHNNVYVSANSGINSSCATLKITFTLKYKCNVSFQYYTYIYNAGAKMSVTLSSGDVDIYTGIDTGYVNKAWIKYEDALAAGEYVLFLEHNITTTSSNNDRGYFADFKITPCIPEKWDWNVSNGRHTAAEEENFTLKAYNSLAEKMKVSDFLNFSHLVWNDLCEKVENMLLAAGGSWKDTDGNEIDGSALIMPYSNGDKTLYAAKYNLLQWQIYRVALQYGLSADADWESAIVSQEQVVDGQKHFIDLTELLNDVIEYINTN